jgi:hypothetical protein
MINLQNYALGGVLYEVSLWDAAGDGGLSEKLFQTISTKSIFFNIIFKCGFPLGNLIFILKH